MRRRLGLLTCVVLLAACAADAAVESERADRIGTVPAVEETGPPETDPEVPEPAETDTTETESEDTPAPSTVPPTSGPRPTLPPGTVPPPTNTDDTEPEESVPDTVAPDTSEDGIGDPLFPDLGSPGIDVQHYDIALRYDPEQDSIAGSVTLTIVPTEDRPELTLDAIDLDIEAVTVDGAPAEFVAEDVELRITPEEPLAVDKAVDVVVTYSGAPDADEQSGAVLPVGWFHTAGGSYVLNEPDGARTWLPSSDHPSDKATYTFRITVPTGMAAIVNGVLVSTTPGADGDVWVWDETTPMATYLIQLMTGDYEVVTGEGPNGLPLVSVVLREDRELMQPYLDGIDEQIDFFDDFFGPYPLPYYGIAMTDSFGGLAMETQARPIFSREDFSSGELGYTEELLLSHELSHMWFGNAVTPAEWGDIWLNESFATYAQWLWLEEAGQSTLEEEADLALETKGLFGDGPTASPDVDGLFSFNSYDGGAVILHALRLTIGDGAFFSLLQRWVGENVGESRRTEDFVALADEVSGQDLTGFFDEWLFAQEAPDEFPEPTAG